MEDEIINYYFFGWVVKIGKVDFMKGNIMLYKKKLGFKEVI